MRCFRGEELQEEPLPVPGCQWSRCRMGGRPFALMVRREDKEVRRAGVGVMEHLCAKRRAGFSDPARGARGPGILPDWLSTLMAVKEIEGQ